MSNIEEYEKSVEWFKDWAVSLNLHDYHVITYYRHLSDMAVIGSAVKSGYSSGLVPVSPLPSLGWLVEWELSSDR